MKKFIILGSILFSTVLAQAQTAADDLFTAGYKIKASISRPMGKVFVSGAIICAPQTPEQTYNYGYTFKKGEALEIVEFQVDKNNDGPAGILSARAEQPNYEAGALQIEPGSKVTAKAIVFSANSMDFKMVGNSISFAPVASIEGTLSIAKMKLNIHVVGTFAQDVEMNCAVMQ